MSGDKLQEGGK